MIGRIFGRKVKELGALFANHFVDPRVLYALQWDAIPCMIFIGEIDSSKAFALINETLGPEITSIYQHAWLDHGEGKIAFNNTLFILNDRRMIELGTNYCQVFHNTKQYEWAQALIGELARFREIKNESVIGFTRQTA